MAHIIYIKHIEEGKGKKKVSGDDLFYCTVNSTISDPIRLTTGKSIRRPPAITVDNTNHIHIAVNDGLDQVLYLNNVGPQWDTVPVNNSGSWGFIHEVDIGVDSSCCIHH